MKCQHGYINKEKRKRILIVLLYFVVGVAIFLTGFFLNHRSKSNVFTVIAILLVLPAAKHLVAFFVLAPYKSLAQSEYERITQSISEHAIVLTDYVFTSEEKVMALSFLVLDQGNAIGLAINDKQEMNYINTYLGKGIHKLSREYKVKIVNNEKDFLTRCENVKAVSITENQEKAVEEWLRSLAV